VATAEEAALNQFLAQLVTAAVVGAFSPVAIMAAIAVLAAEHHQIRNALALLAGWTALLVGLGVAMLALFGGNGAALGDSTKALLNVIIGVLLLSFGLRNLLGGQHPLAAAVEGHPERKLAPPHWMRALDSLTIVKAFGVGAVLLAVSPADLAVFLSAMQGLAGESAGKQLVLTIVLIAAIDLCMLIPIGIYVAVPSRAGAILEQGRQWLIANQRKLMAWVCTGFGLLLLVSGVIHLA
jgi:hypothetical protein